MASPNPIRAAAIALGLSLILLSAGPTSAAAGTVCGQVRDRESGEPVPGAAVVVRDAAGSPLGPVAATGTDGSFCIDGLAPGAYILEVRVDDYLVAWVNGVAVTDSPSSVDIAGMLPPFALTGPWPNPSASETSFSIAVARRIPLLVTVHDLRGRLVRSWSSAVDPGSRAYQWDGSDARGRPVPSGSYLLRIQTRGYAVNRRILLNR